jgi:hypothetical protein
MKFKLDVKRNAALKAFEGELKERLANVGRHLGRQLSTKTTRTVRKRLKGSGWIRLYRDAIIYKETPDGDEWAVAGLSQEEISKFPADKSLASFSPTGDGRWPAEYNPWPIDMIPPATYRGTSLIVRSASESRVEEYRAARARNLPTLLQVLAESNIIVQEEGLPVAENGTFADIAYLARRLELGYPGFDRIPHWGPAASVLERSGDAWLGEPKLLQLVEDAIKGKGPSQVAQMSGAEASDLARLREATWP